MKKFETGLKIYDVQTHKTREFIPIEGNLVKMYVCGPTVYAKAHHGHGRSMVVFDFIRRVLMFLGYRVKFVSNYTDIDDKMIVQAEKDGISVAELAQKIIPAIEHDYLALNILEPNLRPLATEYIPKMEEITRVLIQKGFAYSRESGVYFRVKKFKNYGKLVNFKLEESQSAEADENIYDKESREDFALMKLSKPKEPFWETPWGKMRPGWHIECSAMIHSLLGETIDIHGGGRDLAFPHHTNEIAQSESFTGKKFSNFFVHNGFLTINKDKMSKSTGNFKNLEEVFETYDGDTLRWFYLQAQYRKPLEYSEEYLRDSKTQIEKFRSTYTAFKALTRQNGEFKSPPEVVEFSLKISALLTELQSKLLNDFNSPDAIVVFQKVIKEINSFIRVAPKVSGHLFLNPLHEFQQMLFVFGILQSEDNTVDKEVEWIEEQIAIRNQARSEKDWSLSDKIRDELKERGIILEDNKSGTIWRRE